MQKIQTKILNFQKQSLLQKTKLVKFGYVKDNLATLEKNQN